MPQFWLRFGRFNICYSGGRTVRATTQWRNGSAPALDLEGYVFKSCRGKEYFYFVDVSNVYLPKCAYLPKHLSKFSRNDHFTKIELKNNPDLNEVTLISMIRNQIYNLTWA